MKYEGNRRAANDKLKSGSYLGQIYNYDDIESDLGNEEYLRVEEKGYQSVLRNPLSTFAADVDTASYSNLRRMLSEGHSIYGLPEGSVRIEELINYFDYDYRGPKGSEPFGVNAELSDCPWNKEAKLLSVGLKTEDIDYKAAPSSNLVFLIDVSGSMDDYNKLPLLQDAFAMLTEELSDKDRVSIVTYSSGVETVIAGVSGNNKTKILKAIRGLNASGGTNGGKGIQVAYDLAEEFFINGGNNRVILATDGDLNLGLTSVEELEELITLKKESGVYLSVLGFGTGNLKDNKLETLADKGNGNYSYIDCEKEAQKVLVEELGANLLTVCKDVKLRVEFNPAYVEGYRLLGYANRTMKNKDFNDDTKDGGEIGAGHKVTVLYELILKNSCKKGNGNELLTLSIRYKKPSEDRSQLLAYPIDYDIYTQNPSEDFIFKQAVAEFGLIASGSEYMGTSDIEDVLELLSRIRIRDEYKSEFKDMVETAARY
ncbi:MAG: VWA domain-containing protein [Lachnospiraceae bacterium]|nr:VWA domain-containing protein [Lachnospiraceae bacterium]